MADRWRSPLRLRGQGGYVLTTVLAFLLVFTLTAAALLALVLAGLRMTRSGINNADQIRIIDGAMETGLQQVRGNAASCSTLALVQQGVTVSCIDKGVKQGTASDRRVVELQVKKGSQLLGVARVKVVDLVVAAGDPMDPATRQVIDGYSVEVCDWLLGARQAGGAVKGCSA